MFIRIFLVILPEKMMVEMVAWSAPVGEDERVKRAFEGKMKKKKEVSRPKQRDERWKLGGVGGAQKEKKKKSDLYFYFSFFNFTGWATENEIMQLKEH